MANMKTLHQDHIREMNRSNIINTIREHKKITKHDIAKTLGLSIPTVTTVIQGLLKEGYVKEAGVAQSSGGRKPILLSFNENARYSIGVNITPTYIEIIVTNLFSRIIATDRFITKNFITFDDVLLQVEKRIDKTLTCHAINKDKVLGIGLSLPGLVDEENKMLLSAPNMHLHTYDFSSFESQIGLPIFLENEANVAAFAEVELGANKNLHNVVYISITDGIGVGIIIQQQIFKGATKKAGEFGHMKISNKKIKCQCGRTGCWEVFASKQALLRYYEEETGITLYTLDSFFTEENLAMPAVKKTLEVYFQQLFVGIENITLGLNPEYVMIGGDLGKYRDMLSSYIADTHNFKSDYIEIEGTKVVFSSLKDRGSLLGAALLPLQKEFSYHI